MKALYVALIAGGVLTVRFVIFRSWRARRARRSAAPVPSDRNPHALRSVRMVGRNWLGDPGIIAGREIRERVRGRIFRVGTVIMLVAIAGAIIIPKLSSGGGSGLTQQRIGVVGALSPEVKHLIVSAATQNEDSARFAAEPSIAAAESNLRAKTIDVAIVNDSEVLLSRPAGSKGSAADPPFVAQVADYLGVARAFTVAGLTSTQVGEVVGSQSVPVRTLLPGTKSPEKSASLFGLILLFFMLTQYNTWILIGVMQEKSSRVVEVLLATVRPMQLLLGKVLGIGVVALGQAALAVGFAIALGESVGSDLLKGGAPLVLCSQLLWLLLGYAFYCWAYAAAGSTAERQDQVQTLALPLSIPILIGYVFSITVLGSGRSDLTFHVLAYLPPTAPFCMPVLVALHQATWWQFLVSCVTTIAATVGMAVLAARIYRRAVLHTGSRVRLRELVSDPSR